MDEDLQTSDSESCAATAYHEAGHAVAAFLVGRAFTRVSIMADDHTVGRCSFRRPGDWFRPDVRVDCRTRARMEERIVISLAGPEAEARFTGTYDDEAAQEDLLRAQDLADYMSNNDTEESAAYLGWLNFRTLKLMRHPDYWPAVDALARELLASGEVRYKQARQIIEDSQTRVARTRPAGPSRRIQVPPLG